MTTLNRTSKAIIQRVTGYSAEDIAYSLDPNDVASIVEAKTGKKIKFSTTDRHVNVYGRGNPLLAKRKIRTISQIDESLKKIK